MSYITYPHLCQVESSVRNEIPDFIATVVPLEAGFLLKEGDPRHTYVMGVRKEFGEFLHRAGQHLRSKGPENTVDAAQMLLRCLRTFFLDYGDSKEDYFTQKERYQSEVNLARHYANQTKWPRALFIRKARWV